MKKYITLFLISLILPAFSFAASDSLIINSVQISGTDSSTEEFVTIKNISNTEINLSKYTLVKKSQSATTWNILIEFPNINISTGQVLIISHSNYSGASDLKYTSSTYSIAPNNSVALRKPDKSIVDLVGFGDAITFEGASIQNPEAGEKVIRVSDIDTDNNQNDFELIKNQAIKIIDLNISEVVISEIMPNPKEGKEWFELYNPTSQNISLFGLKICDGIGSIKCYYFKNDDYLSSFEYKIYSQDVTKITLNNDGDYLEIIGPDEQVYASTGENYGDSEKGYSLSLFGSIYKWTLLPTPGSQNVFQEEPAEIEKVTKKKASTKKTTVKKASAAKSTVTELEDDSFEPEVKGANNENDKGSEKALRKINNQSFGIGLMALSIVLLLGYNLWLKKDEIAKVYYKIRSRNN